ncbi:MAG: DMT family transporter [Planctomycetota bacterium]|jgi:transporter family-2 protein
MPKWILIAVVIVVGMLQPVQAGMNAEFRRHVAHPFQAGTLNMVIGAIVVLLVTTLFVRVGPPGPSAISAAPWWSLLGGVIGGAIVITMLISAPLLGAALLIACFVLGQLSSSVLIDHFGWIGYETRPLSMVRLLGIGLLLAGVLLIERGG